MFPKISVIVPTKNASDTIIKTLESITKQTFDNFEVINVDHSTDRTPELVKQYSKKDQRIRYFYNDEVGLAIQRNKGIDLATGEYVTFVDGDDILDKNYLKKLLEVIISEDADISCSNIDYYHIDTGKITGNYNDSSFCTFNNISTCLLLESSKNIQLTLCQGKLLKRDFLMNYKVNENILNEDEGTTYRWYFYSRRICIMNECLYHYYIRPGTLSSQHNEKIIEKALGLCNTYEERYHLYISSHNKLLSFYGWKRLIDISLQYAYIFKKQGNKYLVHYMLHFFKKYNRFRYLFSHSKTTLKIYAKFARVLLL